MTDDDRIRKIVHIDMDAFYASVEQRDAPELRGKAIAVGGSSPRSVVTTASYEARKYGVRSAMPSVVAARKCPHLIFVPPRFDVYRSVSEQIRSIFAEYTALIEPLSLDEAYLDVTDNIQGIPLATEVAKSVRERIFEETGLTASAGISYNKFLAKMASSQRKPNGQFVIPPEHGEAFVEQLPIEKFHGIGPATAKRMTTLGINNGHDLKTKSLPFLQNHFGKSGAYFYEISRGIDRRSVEPNRPRKSVGAENTFSEDVYDLNRASSMLIELTDKVASYCAQKDLHARTVTLKVKYADFEQITRSKSFPLSISKFEEIFSLALALLEPIFPTEKGIRLLGISLSSLNNEEDEDEFQMQLGLLN